MEEKQREGKLYVPYVKARKEYFPGFGQEELHTSIFLSMLFIIGAALAYMVYPDPAIVVLTIITGVVGAIIMCTKSEANISVVGFIKAMIRFYRSQQKFLYQYQNEWERRKK